MAEPITTSIATDPNRCITAAEAEKILGLTSGALAKMRLSGGGPPFFKIGSRVRYGYTDLQDWLRKRRYSRTGQVSASDA